MIKKSIWVLGIAIFIVVIIFLSTNKNRANNNLVAKEKVRVQTGWIINGEVANICSALLNGYYDDEGLDVEILPGGPTGASFIVATNAIAQDPSLLIGVDGDVVPLLRGKTKENKNEELKVKAFASFWNEVPYGFVVRKDSGLKSIMDFAKKKPDGSKYKIGVTADSVVQDAIATNLNIPVSDLDIVIVGFDATPFLAGQVDALAGYWTSLNYEIEKAGIPYTFLPASEIPGFSQPSQVAIATEKTLKEKPDVLLKWLRATIKGSEYMIKNPEISAEQLLDKRCGGSNLNKDQELQLIKSSIPFFDIQKIGWVNDAQIANFANSYHSLKQIPFIPKIEDVVDYSILKNIYK